MGYPVVHFEINSGGAAKPQRFYADAFRWSIDVRFALFRDPRGNRIGLGRAAPLG